MIPKSEIRTSLLAPRANTLHLSLSLSIEQQLTELQAKMGDSRAGGRPPSPTECLQWFNLRAHSGVQPDAKAQQELMDFFRSLVIRSCAASPDNNIPFQRRKDVADSRTAEN